MYKKLIGLLVAMMLLTVGCATQPIAPPVQEPPVDEPNVTEEMPATDTAVEEPANSTPTEESVANSTPVADVEEEAPGYILPPGEPPSHMTWISPGKVMVGNFFPGARAEWPILIHNGNDAIATFSVQYKPPALITEGYVAASPLTQNWVIVADPTPILLPKETREILIAIEMPADAVSPGPNWEFWISVKDTTQAGSVMTELCLRWLVQMAPT